MKPGRVWATPHTKQLRQCAGWEIRSDCCFFCCCPASQSLSSAKTFIISVCVCPGLMFAHKEKKCHQPFCSHWWNWLAQAQKRASKWWSTCVFPCTATISRASVIACSRLGIAREDELTVTTKWDMSHGGSWRTEAGQVRSPRPSLSLFTQPLSFISPPSSGSCICKPRGCRQAEKSTLWLQ